MNIYRNMLSSGSKKFFGYLKKFFQSEVHFGCNYKDNGKWSIIICPYNFSTLNCGLAGIVSFEKPVKHSPDLDLSAMQSMLTLAKKNNYKSAVKKNDFSKSYLGGEENIKNFLKSAALLKKNDSFVRIFKDSKSYDTVKKISADLNELIDAEAKEYKLKAGFMSTYDSDNFAKKLEQLKDIQWCLEKEVSENVDKVKNLITRNGTIPKNHTITFFKEVNSVLNSIDRLEVRGRDSTGISLLFTFTKNTFEEIRKKLLDENLYGRLKKRTNKDVLLNNGISISDSLSQNGEKLVSFAVSYKIAAEIGSLGDNIHFIRNQIRNDLLIQVIVQFQWINNSVSSHTRWASVGAITESNCHPVDNESKDCKIEKNGIIHVCLNGDIDNYLALKNEYEDKYDKLQPDITTDTKIIPMQIEGYLEDGYNIKEAFRLAVNDFEGSHAISMHTDLAPGKLFLAQKGSGQAVFIGISDESFIPASEVYGFVENTPYYIKLDGEKTVKGVNGETKGQIYILDQTKASKEESKTAGLEAFYYDGTLIDITNDTIQYTEITSRDIDRQNFPHYFLKEITESPVSVEKTLQNRWKIRKTSEGHEYYTEFDEYVFPKKITSALEKKQIKRIFFVGQGTAGVAALACSGIMSYYISNPGIQISALKASEFSGFMMSDGDADNTMKDALVVAISQSGTTTDTNLTVDMVKERGAYTLAIVNRRDSDLTFKVDGVIYTSSGRDIEMSVASTKAFYSQIVAGAIAGLHISKLTGSRDPQFVSSEIANLLKLPEQMSKVLLQKEKIKKSAKKYAVTKTYWAAVGSGFNKASSDEIRIKLSELCYKTISSDFVEDKKHIDLSSEPLIIVCAAGTRESVIGDIIKDTAIFNAHKALPIVIVNEGDTRFDEYSKSIFHVPALPEHLAPIVNTLAGHIWGYYAALSINECSGFIYDHRTKIQMVLDEFAQKGMNVYEILLESRFRETMAIFYNEFRKKRRNKELPAIIGFNTASDLTLILKYLSGKLPVSDFESDFDIKGTPINMLDILFQYLDNSINAMSRPIDAIKHQAKTVTVGTSRISEKFEGIIFSALEAKGIEISQLTGKNVLVIKNLQEVIKGIKGSILYRIDNLNLLGQATNNTTISLVEKDGIFKEIASRVESDNKLRGTKSIIVREGNVFIGKGLKDNKNTLIIPALSKTAGKSSIEFIISFNVEFKEGRIPIHAKAKALGGKLERLKDLVQEQGIRWSNNYLGKIRTEDLFGHSSEMICELIVEAANK